MGVETVKLAENSEQIQEFIKYLLKDIRAMERILSEEMFETGMIRIGAEQELCLVDKYAKPSPISIELLNALQDDNFTTELARFNLESNLAPLQFKGKCLSLLETSILEQMEKAGVFAGDITSYLDVIRERTESAQTGSYWMVQSYNELSKSVSREQALTAVTNAMIKNQKKGEPAHKWGLAKLDDETYLNTN